MPRYLPVFSCHFSCFPDLPSGIIFLQPEWHLDWNFSLNYAAITYDYKISLACNNKDFFFSHIYAYGGLTTAMFNVLFISGSKLKEQLLSRTTVLKILLRSITSEWHVASTHTQSANKVIWLNLITLRHESQLEIVGKPSDINKIFPTFFFLFFFFDISTWQCLLMTNSVFVCLKNVFHLLTFSRYAILWVFFPFRIMISFHFLLTSLLLLRN